MVNSENGEQKAAKVLKASATIAKTRVTPAQEAASKKAGT
jgi:hypothetical protein